MSSYQPTLADVAVFEALSKTPSNSTPNALRWYTHIKSYSNDEKKKLSGEKKIPASLGSAAPASSAKPSAPKPAAEDDDDDVDLFGSDEEEVSIDFVFLRGII